MIRTSNIYWYYENKITKIQAIKFLGNKDINSLDLAVKIKRSKKTY